MPLYTEHLNLAKPTRDERYNIAVPNGNMDVIDETIQALREELAGKADIQSTQRHNLELINGFSTTTTDNDNAVYWKTQEGIVVVSFRVCLNGAAIPAGAHDIAVLPQGFRPNVPVFSTAVGFPDSSITALVWIRLDGTIRITSNTAVPASASPENPGMYGSYMANIVFAAAH